jgi:asparagine synthase (glutamine-hydrolysing)
VCGIVGIAAFAGQRPPEEAQLKAMCDSIVHRGPDDEGILVRDNIGLGMRRLSIIDISGGHQPIGNADGSVQLVFNGEIYNYRKLRQELAAQGHTFRTASDSEVIAHAYEAYGDNFPDRLDGMFAFALHDARRQRLVIGRDHLGIKPLFYAEVDGYLIWASEIKAILASGLLQPTLDNNAVAEFFQWEYVPAPRTLFKQIRKLEPGHVIELELSNQEPRVRSRAYWRIPELTPERLSDADWDERIAAAVTRATREQMVSDVPLGAFLSGGVDSSLVVSAMGEAETFSIGFDDPSYNELKYAEQVAAHLNIRNTNEIIRPFVADLFDELMQYMDDPIGDFSIFPTYLLSQFARRHVTVALSGDGGDELFGGYESYLADVIARRLGRLGGLAGASWVQAACAALPPAQQKKGMTNKVKRMIEGFAHSPSLGHARWRSFIPPNLALYQDDFVRDLDFLPGQHIEQLYTEAGEREPLTKALYVDVKSYLVDNCLVKTDRMSMANSLEVRVPLLSKDLVELAFRMPDAQKIRRGETKTALKRVAARVLPYNCVYRQKQGFSIPIKHWLNEQFRSLLDTATQPSAVEEVGVFQPDVVRRLKQEHINGVANHSHVLWAMVIFHHWRRRWLRT